MITRNNFKSSRNMMVQRNSDLRLREDLFLFVAVEITVSSTKGDVKSRPCGCICCQMLKPQQNDELDKQLT